MGLKKTLAPLLKKKRVYVPLLAFLFILSIVFVSHQMMTTVTDYDSPDILWIVAMQGNETVIYNPEGQTIMEWDGGTDNRNIELTISQPQLERVSEVQEEVGTELPYRDYYYKCSFAIRSFANTTMEDVLGFNYSGGKAIFHVDYKDIGRFMAMEVIGYNEEKDENIVSPSAIGQEVGFYTHNPTGLENCSDFTIGWMQGSSTCTVTFLLTVRYYEEIDPYDDGIDFGDVWEKLKEIWGQHGHLTGLASLLDKIFEILKYAIYIIVGLICVYIGIQIFGALGGMFGKIKPTRANLPTIKKSTVAKESTPSFFDRVFGRKQQMTLDDVARKQAKSDGKKGEKKSLPEDSTEEGG